MPQTITSVNGIANITIRSVSNSTSSIGPSDAAIKTTAANVTLEISTNPLSVNQWVDEDSDGLFDWLDQRANACLTYYKTLPGMWVQLRIRSPNIRQTGQRLWTYGVDSTVIKLSPTCGSPNKHRLDTNLELSNTVLHETRHVWQHAMENEALGTGSAPSNDSDRDHCPEAVPPGSEAGPGDPGPIIDGTFPTTGDNTTDAYFATCSSLHETDAEEFASDHMLN